MILKLPLLFLISFAVSSSWANNEEIVTSIHSGANAYLAVTPGKSSSDRELGFHTRHSSDWELALPGEIMLDPTTGPVIHQLEISKSDKRTQILAVVDGFITLLSQATKSDNSKSYLRIGSIENPLIHPLVGTPIYLSPLHSTDQVRIFESRKKGYSVIYMSVNVHVMAGYTFAFIVGPMQDENLSILSDIVLLHEGYLDAKQLENFAQRVDDNSEVTSTIIGNYIVNKVRDDFPTHKHLFAQD